MIQLPDTGAFYYFRFHGRAFFQENEFLKSRQILLISLALLLISGAIIGGITSKVMFQPVKSLMDKIQGLNPENIPDHWTEKKQSNEIGMLTATIESGMNRIREFVQREKPFTRDASHELRTSLTVVKGAVEIMETQPEVLTNPLLKKPLNRISMSVKEMETTVETFLWLAREETDVNESCEVRPAVEKAFANTRHLIEKKDLVVNLDFRDNPVLGVREEILYIAVTNLLRNAFLYTSKGSVIIISEKNCITIQ
ncbi:MAG: HAMP domain-containing histidine kinase [Desulfobacter sp.]|nr:MAG: HAMP domain-containing histidine kinase [Desulfobacter sp.]